MGAKQAHKLLQYIDQNNTSRIEQFILYTDGSVINAIDPMSNQAPLHQCAVRNNTKMLEYIINNCKSVDPNVIDINGRTPLMLASEKGNLETVQILLKGTISTPAASAYIVDKSGRDVFCYSTSYTTARHKAITQILAENKRTQNKLKDSKALLGLLKKGADSNNTEYALDLIKYGSNVNLIDERTGKSVLMYSCENLDEKVCRALL